MLCHRGYRLFLAALVTIILGFGANAHAQNRARLSLDPYAAFLQGGASLIISGFDAPLRLPANGGTPAFALGFTIPNDYAPNTALRVIILWESPATQCNFVLRRNSLFRARAGQPRDSGSAAEGLEPVNASTPFSLPALGTIILSAPATAQQTARVRFDIKPTPGGFPTLQSGDAVYFSIFREDTVTDDTCTDDFGIAGISIVYNTLA